MGSYLESSPTIHSKASQAPSVRPRRVGHSSELSPPRARDVVDVAWPPKRRIAASERTNLTAQDWCQRPIELRKYFLTKIGVVDSNRHRSPRVLSATETISNRRAARSTTPRTLATMLAYSDERDRMATSRRSTDGSDGGSCTLDIESINVQRVPGAGEPV
jgi:hypothetical protein